MSDPRRGGSVRRRSTGQCEKRLRGLTVAAAERLMRGTPCQLRIVEVDGSARPFDGDYVATRINVTVRDGEILAVAGLY